MANPDGYPREGTVKVTHGAGSKTWRENGFNKIQDWELDIIDNNPWFLSVTIDNSDIDGGVNLLSSSCAIWSSGTGAMTFGDKVEFGLYRQDHSTLDWYFEGIIVDIQPAGANAIKVSCYDPGRVLDMIRKAATYYKNVRNVLYKSATYVNGYLKVTGVSDADISVPFLKFAVKTGDPLISFGDGSAGPGSYNLAADLTRKVAQPFIAQGQYLNTFGIYVDTNGYNDGGGNPYNVSIKICNDNPNTPNTPGATLYSTLQKPILGTGNGQSLMVSGAGIMTVEGAKYWLVVAATVATGSLIVDDTGPAGLTPECYKYYNAGAWVTNNKQFLIYPCYFAQFADFEPMDYYFDDGADEVWAVKFAQTQVANPGTIMSYYYGTRTLEEVADWLLQQTTGLLSDINANCDKIFKTFMTRGMSIGDCMRVLMDCFEDVGAWAADPTGPRQHIMAYYRDGSSIPRMKVGKRHDIVNDTEAYTISYPWDRSSHPDEWLAQDDSVNLKKTYKMKYTEVTVIGESPDGRPLIRRVSDRPKSGSLFKLTGGSCERLTVVNKDLVSLDDVNREAYRLLDSVSRDVWEGSIVLLGHHIGIYDLDNTSAYYGSGKIIKLYWSPLGMGGTKMKVTRMVMRMNGTTEIYVNNTDPYLLNKVTKGLGTMEKNEAFLAPVGDPGTLYIHTYYDTAISDNSQMTIKLYDESNVAVPDSEPVNATRYTNSRYNSRVYHAEFECENGRSSGSKVRYVELLKSGVQQAKIDLNRTVASVKYDEMADKFITHRLVVELECKDS